MHEDYYVLTIISMEVLLLFNMLLLELEVTLLNSVKAFLSGFTVVASSPTCISGVAFTSQRLYQFTA